MPRHRSPVPLSHDHREALGLFLLEAHVRRGERELFAFFPEALSDDEATRIGAAIATVLATRGKPRCDL